VLAAVEAAGQDSRHAELADPDALIIRSALAQLRRRVTCNPRIASDIERKQPDGYGRRLLAANGQFAPCRLLSPAGRNGLIGQHPGVGQQGG